MKRQSTAVHGNRGEWTVACIKDIPGFNTQGRDLEEARSNFEDALRIFLEADQDTAPQAIPGRPDTVEEPFALVECAA